MKRGTLLDKEPRVGRKVFATVGFPDFVSGIAVVFFWVLPRHRFGFRNGFFMSIAFVGCYLAAICYLPRTPAPSPYRGGSHYPHRDSGR